MSEKVYWGVLVGIVAGVAGVFGVLLLALLMPRKKCPACRALLPKLRNCWDTPGVVRRCGKCGCGVDLKGKKVKEAGSGPIAKKKATRAESDDDYDDFDDDRPARSSRERRRRDYDEDDEEPSLRRPSRAAGASSAAAYWVVGGVLGGVVLLSLVVVVLVLITGESDPNVDPNVAEGGAAPAAKVEIVNPIPPAPQDLGPKETQTQILGGAFDPTFKDEAPGDGVLIGVDVGLGKFLNLDVVKAVQPRYRTPQGEVAGQKYGTDFSHSVSVKAKPGYAVGALNVKSGLLVNGFSITFMRVKGAALDPADSYSSAWIGDKTGGNGPIVLGGDGTPIVGLIGKRNARDCNGIGLLKKR